MDLALVIFLYVGCSNEYSKEVIYINLVMYVKFERILISDMTKNIFIRG